MFRLSPDVDIKKRSTYTILDLLGDVGGLFDALRACGAIVVSVYFLIRGNPLEKFLLESLFTTGSDINRSATHLKKMQNLKQRKAFKL